MYVCPSSFLPFVGKPTSQDPSLKRIPGLPMAETGLKICTPKPLHTNNVVSFSLMYQNIFSYTLLRHLSLDRYWAESGTGLIFCHSSSPTLFPVLPYRSLFLFLARKVNHLE
jgi:hypothetical protein